MMDNAKKPRKIESSAAAAGRVVLIYAVFAALWIFASDTALEALVRNPADWARAGMFKGLLFVAATALLLYGLLRRLLKTTGEAQQALAAHYAKLIEQARDIVLLTDPAGRIVEANRAAEVAYGYPHAELLGMTVDDLRAPDSLADVERQWAVAASTEGILFETRQRHRDGRVFPVEVSSRAIEIEGKLYRQSFIRDISERKQAQALLQEKEQNYRALAESSAEVAYGMSADWSTMLPLDGRELVASSDLALTDWAWMNQNLPRDEHARVRQAIGDAIARKGLFDLEHRVVRPDGSTGWTRSRAVPILDENGDLVRWFGAASDITERKQTAEALQETQVMLARTEEIGKLGGWEFDIDTLQQTWTKAIYAIHEVDFTNHPTVEQGISFYTPESQPIIEQAVQRAIEHGEPFDLELEIITAKGNRRAVHTIGKHDPVRGKIVGFFQDITERKQAQIASQAALSRLQATFDALPDLLFEADAEGRIVSYHSQRSDLLAAPPEVFIGKRFAELLPPDAVTACQNAIDEAAKNGFSNGMTYRLALPQGECWFELSVAPLHADPEPDQHFIIICHDITKRKRAEESLQQAATVFGHALEGITVTGKDGTIFNVNEAFTRITGYSRDDAIGQNPRILSSGRQSAEFYKEMWDALIAQGHWSGEIWNRRKDGEVYAELLSISAIRDEQGVTQQYVAIFSDITAIKAHQSQLEHMAHFDALTNLPNRVLLADRLHQAMAQAQRRQEHLVVVYLDLDGFKAVNDHYGHETGDQVLIVLAKRFKEAMRDGDTLARISGDEFVIVLVDLEDASASLPLLNRLQAAAELPVALGELSLSLSASLGVTFYPQAQDIDGDQLLRQADQAMYQAKVAGKNRYCIFDAAVDSNVRKQHERLARIRQALERREFVLYYQPKVNMRTGKVIGAEALIRWQHPEDGLLAPAAFLPAIEDHPLAIDVGEWVIDTAMRQMAVWHAAGLDLPVSVNIGARQLLQDDFVERLQVILANHPQVQPGYIELEVLETSALEDVAQASQVIEDCAEIGVHFALDDFGTGYSSLTYLKRLRVAMLKIDQSFVRNMLDDPDDLAILQGIIGLAAAFNREVIAEGVETVAHGTALLQLGCELAQGYGIARPMPPDQLPAWAATWRPDAAWGGVKHSGEAPRSTGE